MYVVCEILSGVVVERIASAWIRDGLGAYEWVKYGMCVLWIDVEGMMCGMM